MFISTQALFNKYIIMNPVVALVLIIGFVYLLSSVYAQVSTSQALDIAQQLFAKEVPSNVSNEYRLVNAKTLYYGPGGSTNIYEVWWTRFVNNIPVDGDHFWVNIDLNTGNILNKEFSYTYPDSELTSIPVLSEDQAKWVVEKTYGNLTGNISGPFIRVKGLYYSMTLKGSVDIEINAVNGSIDVVAIPRSSDFVEKTPVIFNPLQYYQDRLFSYSSVIAIAAILGAFIFLKRKAILQSVK